MMKVDSKPNPNFETPAPADVLAQHLALEPVHRALIRTMEHRLFAAPVALQAFAARAGYRLRRWDFRGFDFS